MYSLLIDWIQPKMRVRKYQFGIFLQDEQGNLKLKAVKRK